MSSQNKIHKRRIVRWYKWTHDSHRVTCRFCGMSFPASEKPHRLDACPKCGLDLVWQYQHHLWEYSYYEKEHHNIRARKCVLCGKEQSFLLGYTEFSHNVFAWTPPVGSCARKIISGKVAHENI